MILPSIEYHARAKFFVQSVLRASEAENYLEEFKLCDFGMCFILEGINKPQTYAGTKEYRPPVRSLYQMLYSENS